ncbi:GtrA family protein [Caballeronia sp. LZ065]|uniref:GtrA family protein n=1 Tax=Caballeronia sp. LZ065 TaxID=3038571 RepID=UPI002857A3CF|nr:GtrA family protein [Caballeronia sp. LZ065]MDR5780961.1 GtrA family protein [Caballeronia sp. LZ065]
MIANATSSRNVRLQFVKYLLVGGLNTALAAAVILGVQAAGARPVVANLIGYGVGVVISFALNSKFTFQTVATRYAAMRFLVVVLVSYLANLGVVLLVLRITHAPYMAQLSGIPVYVIVGFIGNKYWALREAPARG